MDLISRQAAIDAVAELVSSMSVCVSLDECHGMKRMQGNAIRALDELPSVQPERCEECPEWQKARQVIAKYMMQEPYKGG